MPTSLLATALESPALASSNDWMYLTAIGAGSLLFILLFLVAGPRNEKPRRE
ncbi:MAG: hypothetical protein WBO97_06965 [Tepidiformaceae bacterium]